MLFTAKNSQRENVVNLARRIGYRFLGEDKEKREINLVRPLERGGYPRYHLYLKVDGENLIFNLHLDQKRPVYEGFTAHAGEYEGDILKKEAERIKQILEFDKII